MLFMQDGQKLGLHFVWQKKCGMIRTRKLKIIRLKKHASTMIFPIGEPNDKFATVFQRKRAFLAPVSKDQVGIFQCNLRAEMQKQLAYSSF